MYKVSKVQADRLESIKKNVEDAHGYFEENAKRYHMFVRFVFKTALDDPTIQNLKTLQKPPIEFNILEAIISRLRGEFSKQEPSVSVRAADGIRVDSLTPEFIATMEVLEAHLREVFFDATNDSLEYNIYSDLLAGGYSAVEVYTDYINEMSFEQKIRVERVFDPTLTGFDPLARESHKGDGRYCFKIVPWTVEEFNAEFPDIQTKGFNFSRNLDSNFNWSYKNAEQEIVLVCDYYEKKDKKVTIVKLSNGHIITKHDYKLLQTMWADAGFIEQCPIVIEERRTVIQTICRYRFCELGILDYVETDFKFLPIIFIDGNSINMRDGENGATYQMTRPFVFHAMGMQKLKNFAGQTIGAEIQNMVMHKFKVALESIPEEYKDAYKNVQVMSVLVYNAFFDKNPDVPLPPPQEIQRSETPALVQAIFNGSDQTTQMILGSYDTALAVNSDALSGKAIQQGALQSNGAAMPYLMGYIKGLNRIAQVMLDLIPKYYRTPRSLPIMKSNGKRSYQLINDATLRDAIMMNYDPNDLCVKVEAGVNSNIQKQMALEEITAMMQASPMFAAFINEKGLETLLDNMDIRGIDHLKVQAEEFMKEQEEMKQQPPPPSDAEQFAKMELEKTQMQTEQRREADQGKMSVEAAKIAVEKEKVQLQFIKLMSDIESGKVKQAIEQERVDAEMAREAIDVALDIAKHHQEGQNMEVDIIE
jgi:hypothetical protein